MTSDRIVLILCLGVCTYLAARDPDAVVKSDAERSAALAAPASVAPSPAGTSPGCSLPTMAGMLFGSGATSSAPISPGIVSIPAALPSPVSVYPPTAQVAPHVPPIALPDPTTADGAPITSSAGSLPSSPPVAHSNSAPAPASDPAVMAALEQVLRKLSDLSLEVEKLKEWRTSAELASTRRPSRSARGVAPDAALADVFDGAPPVKPLRSREADSNAILGLAKVTEHLMRRIERLEK